MATTKTINMAQISLQQIQRGYEKLGRVTDEVAVANLEVSRETADSPTRNRAMRQLDAVRHEWNLANDAYRALLDCADPATRKRWDVMLAQHMPTEKPRFAPPAEDPNIDVLYLGNTVQAGKYFDLWYTIGRAKNSVAVVYAVHADAERLYMRAHCERAGFYKKHQAAPDLVGWVEGAEKALDLADERIRARKLRLNS